MLIEVRTKVTRKVNNKIRKTMETYLIDKEFFAEAEYAVTDYLTNKDVTEKIEIQSLKQSIIKEIADQYEGKYSFIATLKDSWEEDDGTVKYMRYNVLLWADNLTQANQRVQALSKEGYDMLIEGIKQVDYIYLGK